MIFRVTVLILAFLVLPKPLPAQLNPNFQFTVIADSRDPDFSTFGNFVSLNNSGVTAFNSAAQAIVSSDGISTTTIAATANSDFTSFGNGPDINDSNEVAFTGFISGSDQRVWRGNGGALTSIDQGQFQFITSSQNAISNTGSVPFDTFLGFGSEGVFTGDGTNLVQHAGSADNFVSIGSPIINNNDEVVFFAQESGNSRTSIVTSDGTGLTEIVSSDNWVVGNRPTINDLGQVVFDGTNPSGQTGIHLWNGVNFQLLVGDTGPFDDFSNGLGSSYALNNLGDVAFFAGLDNGGEGIFLGTNPVADRLIGNGDTIAGLTVSTVVLGRRGFNDLGQIAFQVSTAEGVPLIVRADPIAVPEPTCMPLCLLAIGVLTRRKRELCTRR